jgi:hypothetical protein
MEKQFIEQVKVMLRIVQAHVLIGDLKGVKEVVDECVTIAQVCPSPAFSFSAFLPSSTQN